MLSRRLRTYRGYKVCELANSLLAGACPREMQRMHAYMQLSLGAVGTALHCMTRELWHAGTRSTLQLSTLRRVTLQSC